MSDKSPSLMIKTILGHLQNGVEKLESGNLSPEDMELLVEDSKDLYERMIILRYKIYESNVLGVKGAVVSASIRQPEIGTPIDLFESIDQNNIDPEFEISYSNEPTSLDESIRESELPSESSFEEEQNLEENLATQDEEKSSEDLFEADQEEGHEDFEDEKQEIVAVEQSITMEESEEEDAQVDQAQTKEGNMAESSASEESQFDKDQPLWMAQMEANIRDNRSVFPLESLIGAFTLNEKLQFINELFDGSSDDFSSHIKALDQMDSLQAARKKLTELEDTYNWDIESEVLEDFIFKICRRYAPSA